MYIIALFEKVGADQSVLRIVCFLDERSKIVAGQELGTERSDASRCEALCAATMYAKLIVKSEPPKRHWEAVHRNVSESQLSLATSPVLTSGYYSEALSQSVSARLPPQVKRCPVAPPVDVRDEGVVIEAGMSFLLGAKSARRPAASVAPKRRVEHHFRPVAAHTLNETHSSALTGAIKEFLARTDHVSNEWKRLEDGGRAAAAGGVRRVRSFTGYPADGQVFRTGSMTFPKNGFDDSFDDSEEVFVFSFLSSISS